MILGVGSARPSSSQKTRSRFRPPPCRISAQPEPQCLSKHQSAKREWLWGMWCRYLGRLGFGELIGGNADTQMRAVEKFRKSFYWYAASKKCFKSWVVSCFSLQAGLSMIRHFLKRDSGRFR